MRAKVRKGIRYQWVTAFLVLAVIPLVLVNIVYYYNTSKLVQQNVESMTKANLEQTRVSLDVWLESYEDILFQVYTDDGIVELVDRINAGEDVANNRKQLRKTLRGLFYTKDYVKSILIITESGELAFYDQLTASNTRTSWMDSISMSQHRRRRHPGLTAWSCPRRSCMRRSAATIELICFPPGRKWSSAVIPVICSTSDIVSLTIGMWTNSAVWWW